MTTTFGRAGRSRTAGAEGAGRTRPPEVPPALPGADGRPAGRRRVAPRTEATRRVAGRTPAGAATGDARRSPRRRDGSRGATSARSSARPRVPATAAGERVAGPLVGVVLALTIFGLVMVLSASSVSSLHQYGGTPLSQFKRQAAWAVLGAATFVVVSRIDYHRLRRLAAPALGLTVLLLLAVLVPGVGVDVNGSTRWLGVGPVVFQPAELAKLSVVLFCADLLARRSSVIERPDLTVRPVMVVVGVVGGLLIMQPKLGTPIILGAVALLLLFAAGARVAHLIPWGIAAAAAATAFAFSAEYRRARLMAFVDPWADPLGDGLQVLQSQVGIASGGLLGVGLGASRAKWGFLPYAETDFIFAIVAEETGLLGAGALIGLFVLLGVCGFRTALRAPDTFGTLLAAGITTWLLLQAFLNIGMTLGVMPITGEPLPFVSAGGSSLVAALAGVGVLTSVARQARP